MEKDFCGMINIQTGDDFDWKRQRGTTDTADTGPAGDHTSGNGIYFLVIFNIIIISSSMILINVY